MSHLTIGKRIAELRKKCNLTQRDLASKLMISSKAVSKWESDKGFPSLEMLICLHKLLNCSLDYLISGKEREKTAPIFEIKFNLGTDQNGKIFDCDLLKLNNCLIGGKKGSGKSLLLHNIINQLISKYTEKELNFAIIQTKTDLLLNYENLPHLFNNTVYSSDNINSLLNKINDEVETRLVKFKNLNCKNIQEFNIKFPDSKLTYIIVIINELNDIILDESIEGKQLIEIITNFGKSAGIHIIASTSMIESNFLSIINSLNLPTKIALKMQDKYQYSLFFNTPINENEILNTGDILIAPKNSIKISKIHCSDILSV